MMSARYPSAMRPRWGLSIRSAATTVAAAEEQLGASVSVYLDDGPCTDQKPSTIVDLTGAVPRLLRRGVIPVRRLREVVPLIVDDESEDEDA